MSVSANSVESRDLSAVAGESRPGRRRRVALAQIAPTLGDIDRNFELHVEQIERARGAGADAIIFPELSLTGYYLRDIVPEVALPIASPVVERLATLAGDTACVFGMVERGPGDRFYNSAVWTERGAVRGVHRKVYLPTYGLFDEGRYFAAGERIRAWNSPTLGRVGLVVCEDLWHVSIAAIYQADEIDWLVCIANSPARGVSGLTVATADTYSHVARTYATLLGAYVVVVNRAGVEEGLCFWGGSLVVGPSGEVLGQAPQLDPALTLIDVDPAELRRQRTITPLGRDHRLEVTLAELERIQRGRYAD